MPSCSRGGKPRPNQTDINIGTHEDKREGGRHKDKVKTGKTQVVKAAAMTIID